MLNLMYFKFLKQPCKFLYFLNLSILYCSKFTSYKIIKFGSWGILLVGVTGLKLMQICIVVLNHKINYMIKA